MRRHRFTIATCAVAATAVVVALLVASGRTVPVRGVALRVENAEPVATVGGRAQACEGLVRSPAPTDEVGIFGGALSGTPRVSVDVLSGRGVRLARGPLGASGLARLDRAVPAHTPLEVCVHASGGTFALTGSDTQPNGADTMRGVARGTQFSLVLDHRSSFMSALPQSFRRAAIFRPSWVGQWTFWALLAGFALTLAIATFAVLKACDDDAQESESATSRAGG